MSNKKSSNNLVVPSAREAMDKFKMEAANEVGVNLKQGYNGDLSSREAGSVGGQMVKHNCPVRTITLERPSRTAKSYKTNLTYQCSFTII